MAVIDTGLLTKGVRSEFFSRLQTAPSFWERLVTRIQSTTATEQYRWLGQVPQMREWGTGRMAKGLHSESYDVTNKKFEATIEVDRDELADDQTGQIRVRVQELADAVVSHKDYLVSQLLINGATSGYNSYDGVTFWNAAHVFGDSGNQDNDLTTAIVAKDAPTTAEFKAAFAYMSSEMMKFLDDQARPLNTQASGLVCVVPAKMYWTALEAMRAGVISSTDNVMKGAADVIPCPYLDATATDTWYLLKVDKALRPLIFQDREALEFGELTGSSDEGFMREKYYYGVRARYEITYGQWAYAVRMVFTTA